MIMVDELIKWPTKIRCFQGGSCHLSTDGDLGELHAFAKKIGLRRDWFQEHKRMPHYDLTPAKRAKAIEAGAVEVSARQQILARRPDLAAALAKKKTAP